MSFAARVVLRTEDGTFGIHSYILPPPPVVLFSFAPSSVYRSSFCAWLYIYTSIYIEREGFRTRVGRERGIVCVCVLPYAIFVCATI